MKIFILANQKGGVEKSTTAVNTTMIKKIKAIKSFLLMPINADTTLQTLNSIINIKIVMLKIIFFFVESLTPRKSFKSKMYAQFYVKMLKISNFLTPRKTYQNKKFPSKKHPTNS